MRGERRWLMPVFDDPKVEAIYQAGLVRIERIRRKNRWDDGVLVVPFQCYGCDEQRIDLFMMTGDGLPLCRRCFESVSGSPVPANWNPNE
jgi:hypothetical protein